MSTALVQQYICIMGGAFSSSSSSSKPKKKPAGGTITDIDRAVLDLKNSRDRLNRYKAKLERDNEKLRSRAKELNSQGKKSTALNLLKLRKYKLKEVERVDSQLMTIFQMVEQIQSKENEVEVLAAMRSGKNALNKLHEETSIEDVLQLMDEVQEANEVEQEISQILGSGAADALTSDEEDQIAAEFAALEKEMAETKVEEEEEEEEEPKINLPEVPSTTLPEVKNVVEEVKSQKQQRVAVAS